ncbi:hypothetical protein HA402_003107 [Bradysia odoriphaga]|nr:hypothetical protein HA402_003107 [Bradysia odoriphaga]
MNYKSHVDGDRAPRLSYECYVCKSILPTFHDLSNHIHKHSVYQQWIDPSNIILSNWRPEDSQEILQNQPLVLVENLKIDQLNLVSLDDFIDGNSRSNQSHLLERTIDNTQEYEMESTSTDHTECYMKLERNLSECQTKDECTEVVAGNEIVDFLRTVGNRLVNYSQLMQEVYSKSVKVETQTDDNAIMVNKTDIASNDINVMDISSESDDDDVVFISETICCD